MSGKRKKAKRNHDGKYFSIEGRLWKQVLSVLLVLTMILVVLNIQPHIAAAFDPPPEFGGGEGTSEEPWLIRSPEHLGNVRNYLGSTHSDKHFALADDIDLVADWAPIGHGAGNNAFHGSFDGAGFKITNLNINLPSRNHVGLFGYADGATIRNVIIEGVNVTGSWYVGALVGQSDGCEITRCSVSDGSVAGTPTEGSDADIYYIGGLVGYKHTGSIFDCEAAVTVYAVIEGIDVTNARIRHVGGLVGASFNSEIRNSHSKDDAQVIEVKITGQVANEALIEYVGGLVGQVYDSSVIDSTQEKDLYCHMVADLPGGIKMGTIRSVGGLIGHAYQPAGSANINSCVVTGEVSTILFGDGNYGDLSAEAGFSEIWRVGGLIGENGEDSPISDSTSTGNLTAFFKGTQEGPGQGVYIYYIGGLALI